MGLVPITELSALRVRRSSAAMSGSIVSICSDPDTATINLSTLVLSALAYYAWKRGLDECEPAEAPETMYN